MAKTKTSVTKQISTRAPVVVVMGHVDHGKTTLLDFIRQAKVAEKEHGGITQHIGAYQIEKNGQKITFIDTPGHEAFSAMRARGANVGDIAVLVIAADDGVKPQTKESINHIKASEIPMIVAINKTDLPGANLDRVKKGLAENNVLVEGYGGDVVAVPISAKTGAGVDELLEMINLVADLSELKDESKEPFEGVVIESSLDKFRGPVATILIKKGGLKIGDMIKSNSSRGKVKALISDSGSQIKEAGVSTPVEVLGFEKVPGIGEIVEDSQKISAQPDSTQEKIVRKNPFENLGSQASEINLILKADVAGSLEAITAAVEGLGDEKHKVNIVSKETGEVTESDILLATSTKAIIICFNAKITKAAEKLAEEEKVMIRSFNIIYELLDELKEGLEMLAESKREKVLGKGQIIATFDTSYGRVAGTKVTEGRLAKGDRIRIVRGDEEVGTTRIKTIRQRQDEVNLAKEGSEFGILLDGQLDFNEKDQLVAFS